MRDLLRPTAAWWLVGYLAITTVNAVLTLGLGILLQPRYGPSAFDVAYERTVVAHIVVGLATWLLTGVALWRRVELAQLTPRAGVAVASWWLSLSLVVDGVVFFGLLSDTPAGAPPATFYLENQPWTTLYYATVVAGCFLSLTWVRRHRVAAHLDARPPGPPPSRRAPG